MQDNIKDILEEFDKKFDDVCYMSDENGWEVCADDDLKKFILKALSKQKEDIIKEIEKSMKESSLSELHRNDIISIINKI